MTNNEAAAIEFIRTDLSASVDDVEQWGSEAAEIWYDMAVGDPRWESCTIDDFRAALVWLEEGIEAGTI